jgi:hypothetical protein
MAHSVFVADKVSYMKSNYWSGTIWTEYDWRKLEEYKEWCKKNVGANMWNYYGQHKKIPCEFRFKRGEDALAFTMKFVL